MEPMAKKLRLEQNSNGNNNGLMHLNDDFILQIFEYLELDELCTVVRTCRKLKQLVDTFVKLKFRNKFMAEELCIQLRIGRGIELEPADEYVTYFLKFMRNVRICDGFDQRPSDVVDFMRDNCNLTLDRIAFQRIKFHQSHGTLLVDWLSRVEGLAFFGCEKLYEILRCCSKLKNLKIDQYSTDPANRSTNRWANRWMDYKYPTIEHLQLDISPSEKLTKFLIRNPNVKTLTVNLDKVDPTLMHQFMRQLCSMRLEKLMINFKCLQDSIFVKDQLNVICNRTDLVRLELCFNRPEHFRSGRAEWEHLKDLTKLTGLHLLEGNLPYNVSDVISEHVKVLRLEYFPFVGSRTNHFPNLEELYVTGICEDLQKCATPIVRHAVKLKKIVASCCKIKNRTEMTCARLEKHFNDEREQLTNASELVVYIDKGAFDGSTDPLMTEFRLVRLKKADFHFREVNFVDPFLVNFCF